MSQGAFTFFGEGAEGADLRQVEGGYIHHFHQGVCQVTQPSHLAVLSQVGLGKALPLPLCQPQGGQVDHHVLLLMNAAPVPAIPNSCCWHACYTPGVSFLQLFECYCAHIAIKSAEHCLSMSRGSLVLQLLLDFDLCLASKVHSVALVLI